MHLKQEQIKGIAIVLIVIGLAVSFVFDFYRIQAEKQDDTVEILVDYEQLKILADINQIPLQTVAKKFKESGATGVVIREKTLAELESSGDILVLKGNELSFQQSVNGEFLPGFLPEKERTYLVIPEEKLFEEIVQQLKTKKSMAINGQYEGMKLMSLVLSPEEYEKMGIGFPREDMQKLKDAGLTIIPRLRTWGKADQKALEAMTQALEGIPGISMITFNDAGLPGNLGYLANQLEDLKVPVGIFEFYSQSGLNKLALLMRKNAVRIHCISENELNKYNETWAIERFNLAVSERNIRAVYVRVFGMKHPENALEKGLNFITRVKENIRAEGFNIGSVRGLPSIPYSRFLILAVGLGVLGGGLLFLNRFLLPKWTALLGLVGLLGWAGLLYIEPLLARKFFALLAVIIFPVVAVITVVKEEKRTVKGAVAALLKMVGISIIGALIMTGLLADKSFMLKLDQFSGVKVAHMVPLLIIPLYFFFKKNGKNMVEKVRDVLKTPFLVWYALVGLFLLVVLVIYILRTGNEAGVLVSSWENRLRELLDTLLLVRPRTKEFLIGHPVMLFILYYGYTHKKWPLLILGTIGQISLVNTYAHIHTPLVISLLRSFHGLWLGILVGLLLIVVVRVATAWLAGRLSDE